MNVEQCSDNCGFFITCPVGAARCGAGSSLDPRGRIQIQLKGNFDDTPKLHLTKGKNIDFFLTRGSTNIFVYHSPYVLGEIEEVQIDVKNLFPFELRNVKWRPSYISIKQPVTGQQWGCRFNTYIKCENEFSTTAHCSPNLRDRHSFLKALFLFHPWLSVFNCPVRIGMYNTLVHVIFTFFMIAVNLTAVLVVYLKFGPESISPTMGAIAWTWIGEIIIEAVLRNTIPKFGTAKGAYYQGLVKPVKPKFGVNDFDIIYKWDAVRPLVPKKSFRLVGGSLHASCYALFPVTTPQSVFNLWGLLGPSQEKETSIFLRSLNSCALPLPLSMMWLSIEAAGLKENLLIRQAMVDYKSPFCVFDSWLRDWPQKYPSQPYIAGLIISHIICKDMLNLIKAKQPQLRATMAQVCVNQWYGLLCCLFLYIIMDVNEEKGNSITVIHNFTYRTLLKFGKRTPREIQTSWEHRNNIRNDYGYLLQEKAGEVDNVSASATWDQGYGQESTVNASYNIDYMIDVIDKAKGLPIKQQIHNPRTKDLSHTHHYNYLNKNTNRKSETVEDKPFEYVKMSRPFYETFSLGPAFVPSLAPRELPDSLYLRHRDEMRGYCCKNKKCVCFYEIHEKVGKSCMEVLRDALLDLHLFMKRSHKIKSSSHIWKRKDMVYKMIKDMRTKAQIYESSHFQTRESVSFEDFECQRLYMGIYDILQDIIEGGDKLSEETSKHAPKKPYKMRRQGKRRCIFCAKLLKIQTEESNAGCDSIEQLVKFFTKGTISVAHQEMKCQVEEKMSLSYFCASIISQARSDVLFECEDPPLTMASIVLQATAYNLLTEMLPKKTDFKDMSQDELRRLGTRLQRIKARRSVAGGGKFQKSLEERTRLAKITHLIEEMGLKWRMTKKEKSLATTTKLFAKALVHERLFGITVYSGFISKEHELLIGNNKYWLMEMETVATFAVVRIARMLVSKILKRIISQGVDIDVIFHEMRREMSYLCEQVNVHLYNAEPTYLSTCCYYINNIVEVQLKLFMQILENMRTRELHEGNDKVAISKKSKQYEINAKKISLLEDYNHEHVSSPLMRWGEIAISGEPPLPLKCRPLRDETHKWEDVVHDYLKEGTTPGITRELLAALVRLRRGLDHLLQSETNVRSRQLQSHLSNAQANLTDQIAAAMQAISHSYILNSDHSREFHRDDLFNTEYFASYKLNLPFITLVGIILLSFMVVSTVTMILLITLKTTNMPSFLVIEWLLLCLVGFAFYAGALEPIKCIFYGLVRLFVD